MVIFRMNGFPITRPSDFIRHFSPADYLRSRELAAGFVCQQMRRTQGPWCYYCSKVLEQAVFNWENNGSNQQLSVDFFLSYCSRVHMRTGREYSEAIRVGKTREIQNVLEALLQLSRETGLPDGDMNRLFCLLGAGYCLAARTPDEIPLSARDARAAYLRLKTAEKEDCDHWVEFPVSGELNLEARVQPYRILLNQNDARASLAAGGRIHPCRLLAMPHRHGSQSLPVILNLYQSMEDENPKRVELMPGEYCYISCVRGIPYYLHPGQVQCGKSVMTRSAAGLTLALEDRTIPIAQGRDNLISFAPEHSRDGYILVTEAGADFSHYSLQAMFMRFTHVTGDIVEVKTCPDRCYTLRADGCVFSSPNNGECIRKGVLMLDEVVQR